jgi:hypothetical protein
MTASRPEDGLVTRPNGIFKIVFSRGITPGNERRTFNVSA